ncbi:MAG: Lrp/AsnC ligand binding domain-containing protein [Candidatus Nitrosocaldaceae archaeon]
MHSAIVLINCDLGYEEDIIREISKIEGVRRIVGTYGVYDLVADVTRDTLEELNSTVASIRRVNHIRSTITLVVIEGQGIEEEEMYR